MKKLLLPFLFVVLFIGSCSDDSITLINPYAEQLREFNTSSGFDAKQIEEARKM